MKENTTQTEQMKVFKFNQDDLSVNKHGMITERQRKLLSQYIKITRFNSGLAMFFTAISLLFVFGLPFFLSSGPAIRQALPFLIGTALVVFAITGFFTWIGLRRLKTLQNEVVSVSEGTIRLESKKLDYGRLKAYYLRINEIRLQLTSEKQFKSLVNGGRFRIFYIHYPPTHIILSLEDA